MKTLIDRIESEICIQVERLDEIRRQSFLTWLHAHQSIVLAEQQTTVTGMDEMESSPEANLTLKNNLAVWLKLLPLQNLLIEYRLILDEISWWHDLEANTLADWVLRNDRKVEQ